MWKFLRDLDLALVHITVLFAVVPYATLTIVFYDNDGWFHLVCVQSDNKLCAQHTAIVSLSPPIFFCENGS